MVGGCQANRERFRRGIERNRVARADTNADRRFGRTQQLDRLFVWRTVRDLAARQDIARDTLVRPANGAGDSIREIEDQRLSEAMTKLRILVDADIHRAGLDALKRIPDVEAEVVPF